MRLIQLSLLLADGTRRVIQTTDAGTWAALDAAATIYPELRGGSAKVTKFYAPGLELPPGTLMPRAAANADHYELALA
ncbi:hypothetical protein LNV23_19050 [Paucibacter sp. DJ1R-11]|uniref:hypothetical protein n=1 Tax=Paucibacter sp. DJ1R-11 TaxID=2893556 RepID=UPI0021E3CD8A|nr:hypothetical protein [Paucibacter sp. DJ1R-11]MCV2365552.1 hypothetical protein [Paucibacter sp. DJ1R-11]